MSTILMKEEKMKRSLLRMCALWGAMAIGILPAILPYVRARRLRKSIADSRGDIDPD